MVVARLGGVRREQARVSPGLAFIVFILLSASSGPHIYVTNQTSTDLLKLPVQARPERTCSARRLGYDQLGRLMVAARSR